MPLEQNMTHIITLIGFDILKEYITLERRGIRLLNADCQKQDSIDLKIQFYIFKATNTLEVLDEEWKEFLCPSPQNIFSNNASHNIADRGLREQGQILSLFSSRRLKVIQSINKVLNLLRNQTLKRSVIPLHLLSGGSGRNEETFLVANANLSNCLNQDCLNQDCPNQDWDFPLRIV